MGNVWSENIWLGKSSGEVDVAKLSVTDHGHRRTEGWRLRQTRQRRMASVRTKADRQFPARVANCQCRRHIWEAVAGANIQQDEIRRQFCLGMSISSCDIVGTDKYSARIREEILKRFNAVTFENEWR